MNVIVSSIIACLLAGTANSLKLIAGFCTYLMKPIQKGHMEFVADESAIKIEEIKVVKETIDMLAALGMSGIPGVVEAGGNRR